MLVDDDEDDQDIFREAVSIVRPDAKLIFAKDGEQGLSQLDIHSLPDYIFLDVNMPRMNGKEFLRLVKASPQFEKIPVVIYSTSNHQSELGEYFKMGASDFLTKPSEFSLLLTYLKSLLHG